MRVCGKCARGSRGGARSWFNNARYKISWKGARVAFIFFQQTNHIPLYQLILSHGLMNIMTPQDKDDEHIMAHGQYIPLYCDHNSNSCTCPDHIKLFACIIHIAAHFTTLRKSM